MDLGPVAKVPRLPRSRREAETGARAPTAGHGAELATCTKKKIDVGFYLPKSRCRFLIFIPFMVLETGSIRLSPSAYGMGRWALASHSNWKLKLFVFVNLLFCLYIFSNLRFWHALPAGGHGDDARSGDALQRAGEQPVRVHRLDQNHGDGQGGARKEKNLFFLYGSSLEECCSSSNNNRQSATNSNYCTILGPNMQESLRQIVT